MKSKNKSAWEKVISGLVSYWRSLIGQGQLISDGKSAPVCPCESLETGEEANTHRRIHWAQREAHRDLQEVEAAITEKALREEIKKTLRKERQEYIHDLVEEGVTKVEALSEILSLSEGKGVIPLYSPIEKSLRVETRIPIANSVRVEVWADKSLEREAYEEYDHQFPIDEVSTRLIPEALALEADRRIFEELASMGEAESLSDLNLRYPRFPEGSHVFISTALLAKMDWSIPFPGGMVIINSEVPALVVGNLTGLDFELEVDPVKQFMRWNLTENTFEGAITLHLNGLEGAAVRVFKI